MGGEGVSVQSRRGFQKVDKGMRSGGKVCEQCRVSRGGVTREEGNRRGGACPVCVRDGVCREGCSAEV